MCTRAVALPVDAHAAWLTVTAVVPGDVVPQLTVPVKVNVLAPSRENPLAAVAVTVTA